MSKWTEGNPNSKILFLAQAPSYVEERMGRPLVGPSGEVFDSCLHAAGIVRRGSCIVNLWPEQVVKTKRGTVEQYHSKGGDLLWDGRALTAAGLALGADSLALVRDSGANVVVPLGAQALQACIGDKRPIGKWRGSILRGVEAIGHKKIIPTFHPAATIHGVYLWRYIIISDFEKARRHSASPEMELPKRRHIIAPTHAEALAYLRQSGAMVATDLEVINHQVACFSICYDPSETMTIPLTKQDGSDYWTLDEEIDIWLAYASLMGDPDVDKINQNLIGFDVPFLFTQMGIRTRGFMGDTMIAQKIMYPEFRKGLDFITSIRTDEPYYKDEGKMWKGLGGSVEEFWTYCGKDSAVALESWHSLAAEMTEEDYWPTYHLTARRSDVLLYMGTRGWKVDLERLKVTLDKVAQETKDRYDELKAVAEYEFNPLSPKQCQQYFYGHKGIKPYIGKTGGVTTDDTAMSRIVRRYNLREAKLVQEIRALEKLKGTYLEIIFDKDERLRCAWDLTGTWTGRLSSSQTVFGTGANMQNLHPEFREFLVADKEPLV